MNGINYEKLELIESIFDNIKKAFVLCELIYDDQGRPINYRFLKANKMVENHTGVRLKEMLGKTAKELFPGLEQIWIDKFAASVLEKKHIEFTEYNHNTDKHYKVNCFSPAANKFIAVFEDISHEIDVEKKLEKKEKEYQQIFESMTDLFQVIKLIYDENNNVVDWTFLQVNPAFEKLTNLSKSEIVGKKLKSVFGTVEEKWLKTYQKIDETEKTLRFEDYSEELAIHFDVIAWKIEAHTIGVIFSDITSRKQTETFIVSQNKKLRIAEEKAKENEALKSAFLLNMSHEIRTPLNAILGFASLLAKNTLSNEQRQKYIELIQLGGNRLLRVLSDVSDMSKLDTKQFSLMYDSCNLNSLLRNSVAQFKLTAAEVNCHIKLNCGLKDYNSEILTDETRLMQILSNLIVNALRYTKNGTITIGYVLEGKTLRFSVKDTGIGIAAKHHKKIFDRFVQVENSNSSGTGLGLSIIKEIIELMSGKIWLKSKKGEGAEFYFNLPYTKGLNASINPASKAPELATIEDPTILVAEDEIINYLYLEALFEDLPFNLKHAKNGAEAIEMTKNNPSICMVLMDIRMPEKNGIEAALEIRKTNVKIPIIALTAYALEDDNQNLSNREFNGLLTKPFNKEELTTLIEMHL